MQPLRHIKYRLSEVPASHWKFSGVEFLFWFAWAAAGYLSVFLQSKGYSASEVGFYGALNSAAGIIAAPFWGMIADKMRSVRKVLLILLIVSALSWGFVPLSSNVAVGPYTLALLVIPFGAFFRMPVGSLLDSWVVQNANRQRLNYGAIRLWGSIGYAVMNMSLSAILPYMNVSGTFVIFGIAVIPLVLMCFFIKDDVVKVKSISFRELKVGRLFKNYYYVTYLCFAVALQMPVNTIMTFLPYLMAETGLSTNMFGLLMGFRALFEIPMLIFAVKLRKRLPMPILLVIAASLYIMESFSYSFINGLFLMLAVSALHGFGGGMFIGSSSNYIYSLAPDELKATAQTVAGSVNSLAGIIGNLLGGYLLDSIGVRSYYAACGGIVLFALVFFLITLFAGKRYVKQESPLILKAF